MEYRIQTLNQLKPLVQGFRRKSGLTQAAMAEQLGVSQQAYAQIESNLSSTSVERLYTILRLLNIDINFTSQAGAQAITGDITSASPQKFVSPIKVKKSQDVKVEQSIGKNVTREKRSSTLSKAEEASVNNKRRALASPVKLSKRSDTTKW
ncbi:helix-turn-helix transcriptional regulator [Undibacterium sp. LX40W]|uniref:Helix-turn-helix transcriptional regulator n=1 Tax=Undibacterium nitidum TaxID=2762298 RepID=A0A923HUP2_9BURK|nr:MULTISPECIES: helix-turn-helix transcriptional regulator [Undibacterium]MBC3881604.1 helix-turn-helix transcriptional regulator [Undibacterium nitidum]MBC3891613.1 helix-turn-helix transcriptional regulator [Undibacterium sp. LX40W]